MIKLNVTAYFNLNKDNSTMFWYNEGPENVIIYL